MNDFSIVEVSIIMPAHNAEKYIYNSILSVQNQTFKNWELIVIDDNSNDFTASIVKQSTLTDERIFLVQHEQNLGTPRDISSLLANGRMYF